jgi:segregation and condensation protein B
MGDPAAEEEREAAPLPPRALIGALLFSSAKPLSVDTLRRASGLPEVIVEQALEELEEYYRDDEHGFSLKGVNGGYQFRTAPGSSFALRRVYPPKVKRLSRAAAETLAVIAYKQPVQRAEIEAIRGVDALPTLKTLLDHKLVRVVGHEDAAGQPALYATTSFFLERFGLSDLSDLPTIRELGELAAEEGEVEETEEETNHHSASE